MEAASTTSTAGTEHQRPASKRQEKQSTLNFLADPRATPTAKARKSESERTDLKQLLKEKFIIPTNSGSNP